MKRYFVAWTFAVAVLTLSGVPRQSAYRCFRRATP